MRPATFDKERISLNLARMKKGGENFEVVIDPDKVIESRKNKSITVSEMLRYEKIFSDAKKGFDASEEHMKAMFNSTDPLEVAKIILDEGEIQFTQEYRDQLRQEKLNKIVSIITRNAIDPRTHLPHPRTRIESALEQGKIRIDLMKSAEDQVNDVIDALRPVLPIKFAKKDIWLKIPPNFAGKGYPLVQKYGKIKQDNWQSDGSWICTVEIPAGLQNEFFDALNSLTHGQMESKIVSER